MNLPLSLLAESWFYLTVCFPSGLSFRGRAGTSWLGKSKCDYLEMRGNSCGCFWKTFNFVFEAENRSTISASSCCLYMVLWTCGSHPSTMSCPQVQIDMWGTAELFLKTMEIYCLWWYYWVMESTSVNPFYLETSCYVWRRKKKNQTLVSYFGWIFCFLSSNIFQLTQVGFR